MPTLARPGLELYYEVDGDGPPLLLIAGLASRHIALALEGPGLSGSYRCSKPGRPGELWMVRLADRLRKLGGRLDYFVMDSPFVSGHVAAPGHDCPGSIAEIAADAAATAAGMRRLFPDVRIGEIELVGSVVGGAATAYWSELDAWHAAFHAASGQPIAFLHADIDWGRDWREQIVEVARRTRAAGMPFGVLYDGSPAALSDQAQAAATWRNIESVEAVLGGPPDHAVFQSWFDFPHHVLPETEPSSMTGVMRDYLRPATRFAPASAGRYVLSGGDGQPLAGATVRVEAEPGFAPGTLAEASLAGEVPHAARRAMVGLRLRRECHCPMTPIDLALADVRFTQPQAAPRDLGADIARWRGQSQPGHVAVTGGITRFSVPPEAGYVFNGTWFAVMPDAEFALRLRWRVTAATAGAGHLDVIFAGAEGGEIRRTALDFTPTWTPVGTVRTAADGSVVLPAAGLGGGAWRLSYSGDGAHRGATLVLGP